MKKINIELLSFLTILLLCILFKLDYAYIIFILAAYLFLVPHFKENHRIQTEEWERFQDINLYMSQMTQSFISHKNILSSLKETAETFPSGNMKTVIEDAVQIILMDGGDISVSEKKAFSYLEETYSCEKLRNLHEFLFLAESHGGNCKEEFVILEKSRIAWETALSSYRQKLISQKNVSAFFYLLLLGLCLFILHAFPEDLRIIHLFYVQITNTLLLLLFILFCFLMDKKTNGILFKPPVAPTEHTSKRVRKREIQAAFPKWLFDLLLLIQRQSVDRAILQSTATAPKILQAELSRISQLIIDYPGSIDAYLSFLAEYRIPQIETTMRKLYALSTGAGKNNDTLHFLIETNMESLIDAERKSYEAKGDASIIFQLLPMLIVTLAMLVYSVAIILLTLSRILNLFN